MSLNSVVPVKHVNAIPTPFEFILQIERFMSAHTSFMCILAVLRKGFGKKRQSFD